MVIESISAQSKIVMMQVPGVTGAGSVEMLADNSLVQLFPQNRKPSSESTAGSAE